MVRKGGEAGKELRKIGDGSRDSAKLAEVGIHGLALVERSPFLSVQKDRLLVDSFDEGFSELDVIMLAYSADEVRKRCGGLGGAKADWNAGELEHVKQHWQQAFFDEIGARGRVTSETFEETEQPCEADEVRVGSHADHCPVAPDLVEMIVHQLILGWHKSFGICNDRLHLLHGRLFNNGSQGVLMPGQLFHGHAHRTCVWLERLVGFLD